MHTNTKTGTRHHSPHSLHFCKVEMAHGVSLHWHAIPHRAHASSFLAIAVIDLLVFSTTAATVRRLCAIAMVASMDPMYLSDMEGGARL